MTNPAPPPAAAPSGESGIGNFLNRWKDIPRWQLAAFVIGGAVVAYLIYRAYTNGASSQTGTADWSTRAVALLVQRGYSPNDAQGAVNRYTSGGALSPKDIALISVAIRALGTPDMPSNQQTNAQLSAVGLTNTNTLGNSTSSPGAPYSGSNDYVDGDTTGIADVTSYWYVPVGVAGWSTTFGGIAQQFYGDTTRAVNLQTLNPGLSSTTYGKLPFGALIKVPRT